MSTHRTATVPSTRRRPSSAAAPAVASSPPPASGGGPLCAVLPRPTGTGHAAAQTRRTELSGFLRACRARIAPEDVGLPPGLRRRTPGLRREEVAQLAGVGITWYTWLEQGRRINASAQVLDAVARTLRLNAAEREHLFRLADVGALHDAELVCPVPPEIREIVHQLHPLAAAVYTDRFDVLAFNPAYAALFPVLAACPDGDRNALRGAFAVPPCCSPFDHREVELKHMAARLRTAYGRHLGEPSWTAFIERMCRDSVEFAAMWARQEVMGPESVRKHLRTARGSVRVVCTTLATSLPGMRITVYTPDDAPSRARIQHLVDHLVACLTPGCACTPGTSTLQGALPHPSTTVF